MICPTNASRKMISEITVNGSSVVSGDTATISNMVTTNTEQEISNLKTFTNGVVRLKNTSVARNQTVSGRTFIASIPYRDKNNNSVSELECTRYPNGNVFKIFAYNSSGTGQSLEVVSNDDGTGYANAPYRTTGITTSDILTAGNGVTLGTDQTVTGTKTFTNCVNVQLDNNPTGEDIGVYTNGRFYEERDTPRIYIKTTKHKRGTPAGSNSNSQIWFYDSDGNIDAGLVNRYSTAKDMRLQLFASNTKTDDSSAIAMSLFLHAFQSGVTCAVLEGQRSYVKTNTQDILTIGNLNSAIEIDGSKYFTGTTTSPNHSLLNRSLVQNGNSSAGGMTLNFLGRNSANTGDVSRAYIQHWHSPGTNSASSTNLLYMRAYKDNCTDYVDLALDATNGAVGTNGILNATGMVYGSNFYPRNAKSICANMVGGADGLMAGIYGSATFTTISARIGRIDFSFRVVDAPGDVWYIPLSYFNNKFGITIDTPPSGSDAISGWWLPIRDSTADYVFNSSSSGLVGYGPVIHIDSNGVQFGRKHNTSGTYGGWAYDSLDGRLIIGSATVWYH